MVRYLVIFANGIQSMVSKWCEDIRKVRINIPIICPSSRIHQNECIPPGENVTSEYRLVLAQMPSAVRVNVISNKYFVGLSTPNSRYITRLMASAQIDGARAGSPSAPFPFHSPKNIRFGKIIGRNILLAVATVARVKSPHLNENQPPRTGNKCLHERPK